MLSGILFFVAGVFLMILAHELGHFLAARAFGIKVEEFFIGFGPRVWSFRRAETEYGLKLLPLGGYVRIAGMNPFQETPPEDLPRTFGAKPKWQRAVVLGAGSATHFVLALLVLAALFAFIGIPRFGGPQIAQVERTLEGETSPAAEAGLRPGDVFVRANGEPIRSYPEFLETINESVGEQVTLVVERDGRRLTVRTTPVRSEVQVGGERREIGRLGIVLTREELDRDRSGPLEAFGDAGRTVGQMVVNSFRAMAQVFGPEGLQRIGTLLVGEEERSLQDPVGIVGAARFSGQAAAANQIDYLLSLFAFFNVFVGILNILPLPPLDGGHLAVLGVEAATGKRIDPRKLIPITAVVAGFLILFTLSLLYLDIVRPIPDPFQ